MANHDPYQRRQAAGARWPQAGQDPYQQARAAEQVPVPAQRQGPPTGYTWGPGPSPSGSRPTGPYADGYVPRGANFNALQQQAAWSAVRNHKSKSAAIALAFFMGVIGAHNFYLGQIKRGIGHCALLIGGLLLTPLLLVYEPQGPWWSLTLAAGYTGSVLWSYVETVIIAFTPEDRLGQP